MSGDTKCTIATVLLAQAAAVVTRAGHCSGSALGRSAGWTGSRRGMIDRLDGVAEGFDAVGAFEQWFMVHFDAAGERLDDSRGHPGWT